MSELIAEAYRLVELASQQADAALESIHEAQRACDEVLDSKEAA